MPTHTVKDFGLGLDRRLSRFTADANRLYNLKNAFVTLGKEIESRPGLTLQAASLANAPRGLVEIAGRLKAFIGQGPAVTVGNLDVLLLSHPTTPQAITEIHFAEAFNGVLYVVAQYADGSIVHHYLDGTVPTHVADLNCPQTAGVTIAANKIYAVGAGNGDIVNHSATNNPRDWTTANDAGFIATALQGSGDLPALALGQHIGRLIVFGRDFAQSWIVDANPANNRYVERVDDAGTRFARSIQTVGGDVFFLSDAGVRSISTTTQTDHLREIDVGSPIDALVRPVALAPAATPLAAFWHAGGQYWLAVGNRVFAYTYSRTAKITAWGDYEFPFLIDDIAELNGALWVRSGSDLYVLDESVAADNGVPYSGEILFPYLDSKAPTQRKQYTGFDMVADGDASVDFLYDERDPTLASPAMPISGVTRPGPLFPMELLATAVAPRITFNSGQPFKLHALSMHYRQLGRM